jgi:hypothetical protein
MSEALGELDAVLVIDETGYIKKSQHSVGQQHQYSGTAGRIENYPIGGFLSFEIMQGRTLLAPGAVPAQRMAGLWGGGDGTKGTCLYERRESLCYPDRCQKNSGCCCGAALRMAGGLLRVLCAARHGP